MEGTGRQDKTFRILRLYELLSGGGMVSREQLRAQYAVSTRSIERDIAFLNEYLEACGGPPRAIRYDEKRQAYRMGRRYGGSCRGAQALAAMKALLALRAFTREEMEQLLEGLLSCLSPQEREAAARAIGAERLSYLPVSSAKPVFERLWEVAGFIGRQELIRFDYVRQDGRRVSRLAEPVAVMFAENYFYLLAYYRPHRGNKPVILRLDRLENLRSAGEKTDGTLHSGTEEYMRTALFMYGGREMTIRFRFWGDSRQAVLDRLPYARVVKEETDGRCVIEARVMGEGVKRWLLSQLDTLEVLEPYSLRQEMAQIVENLHGLYHPRPSAGPGSSR